MMRELTLVLPFYMNVGMFAEQQKVWASYPDDLKRQLHVIVVDDCSPKTERATAKAIAIEGLASVRLYRLIKKRRWNWLACRNLGAKLCETDWMLLTDMDHVLPVRTLARLVEGPLEPHDAYRFARVDAPHPWPYALEACAPYKMHNDTWCLTRDLFFSEGVFGYDERLSGLYGTSGEFKDRVMATARAVHVLPEPMIRYPREVISDASTSPMVYTRKNDPVNDAELRRRKTLREQIPDWRPLHGLVPSIEVFSTRREEAV